MKNSATMAKTTTPLLIKNIFNILENEHMVSEETTNETIKNNKNFLNNQKTHAEAQIFNTNGDCAMLDINVSNSTKRENNPMHELRGNDFSTPSTNTTSTTPNIK